MKGPNLILRSLLATGGLLLSAGLRHEFTSRGGVRDESAMMQLIVSAVGVTVGGLLAGLFLHWCWPRTRSRGAGALVGWVATALFLGAAWFALGLWFEWPPVWMAIVTGAGGLLIGAPIGAWNWPPRGSERLSSADLIVGRE